MSVDRLPTDEIDEGVSRESGEKEALYKEKNNAVIAPESYYNDLTVKRDGDGEERYYELFDEKKPKSAVWSVFSLLIGIASVVTSLFVWYGMILGVLAIICATVSRIRLGYFDTFTVGGMILGIFGTVFGLARLIFLIIIENGIFVGKEPNVGVSSQSDI